MNTSPLCVDANLIIRLVADPGDESVRTAWDAWDAEHRLIAAPTLLFYEVSNALYRYQRAGVMSRRAVCLALRAALALPFRLYAEPHLQLRAVELAEELSLPAAYDAHYLALAEWLGAEFWTADMRLVHSVQDRLPFVRALQADDT